MILFTFNWFLLINLRGLTMKQCCFCLFTLLLYYHIIFKIIEIYFFVDIQTIWSINKLSFWIHCSFWEKYLKKIETEKLRDVSSLMGGVNGEIFSDFITANVM